MIVNQIPIEYLYLILLVDAIVLVIILRLAFQHIRHGRLIEDTPTAKLRSAAQGYVEIQGHQNIFTQAVTCSPYSQDICTWYEVKLEQHVRSGKNSYWHTIDHRYCQNPIYVYDGTGECIVCPDPKTKIYTSFYRSWHGFSPRATKPPKNIVMKILSWFGSYRFSERLLLPETPIYVIGMLATYSLDNAAMLSKFGIYAEHLSQWQDEQVKVISSLDLPSRRPFIVSAQSQAKITSQYRWGSRFYLVLFLLFLGLSFWTFQELWSRLSY